MRKKILIVEDIPALIHILELEVQRLGYETILANNGEEAVEMALAQLPNLIMMDIMMPEMDGLEAARLIRENPKTRSIPIIAVTALSSRKDKEKCLESGCDDYLSKPFTASQLSSSITELLKQNGT
jgi:two-component system cell cycle response regulator